MMLLLAASFVVIRSFEMLVFYTNDFSTIYFTIKMALIELSKMIVVPQTYMLIIVLFVVIIIIVSSFVAELSNVIYAFTIC